MNKRCQYCGEGGFTWGYTQGLGWRLTSKGVIHSCEPGFRAAAQRRQRELPAGPEERYPSLYAKVKAQIYAPESTPCTQLPVPTDPFPHTCELEFDDV